VQQPLPTHASSWASSMRSRTQPSSSDEHAHHHRLANRWTANRQLHAARFPHWERDIADSLPVEVRNGSAISRAYGGMSNKTSAIVNRENSCDKTMPSTSKEETMTHSAYMIRTSNPMQELTFTSTPLRPPNPMMYLSLPTTLYCINKIFTPLKSLQRSSPHLSALQIFPSPALIFPLLLQNFNVPTPRPTQNTSEAFITSL
jgi:hypothetical protein